MEKEFDFNSIGKRTPFRTPDGFFERMQAETMKRVAEEKRKKKIERISKIKKYIRFLGIKILYLWKEEEGSVI